GRWMAYTHTDNFDRGTIFLFDTSDSTTHQVTSNLTYDSNPTWDPEGNYLHFMSNRTVRPTIGSRDFETIIEPGQRPYSLLLREDVENPFLKNDGIPPLEEEESDSTETDLAEAETDSLEVAETDSLGTEAPADSTELAELEKDEDEEKLDPVEIDFDGILSRYIEHEKVPPGRYFGLQASKDKLFFLARPDDEEEDDDESGHGSFGGLNLKSYQIEDEELSTFARGVRGYQLLNEKNKILLVKIMGGLQVVDSMAPPGPGAEMMDVSGLQIELDPREEWHQIYRETWRVMRDFYWDESMQGVDWQAVHDQYAPLLDRIASRSDLNDILAEMIGELSTGHTYVFGGDHPQRARRRGTGLLGATLQREGEAFRVDHIYRGGQLDRRRSPLDVPGVEVDEGDYILEVNLRQVPLDRPFESALDNLAGRDVMLTVADSLGGETRHVIVHTLRSDSRLVYLDWVRQNREAVSEATGGRIGYIHIPDMGMRGLTEFGKWFYPQLDKEGMVVDVRWNGGGFVSQLILERFQRHIISWDRQRRGGVMTYPYRVLNGPFVVLTNEHAGSDGDIFPAAVQLDGLAPVIGKRSWGGVIGIRGFMGLVDGGGFSRPEFAWWDSKRGWSLEGHGVDPDIEVDNRPQDLARGEDPQLDRAIEEVLKLHRKHPPLRPDFGPAPDRSREAYRKRELN
ncbi:MAG: S41 family peptidase, partial [Candidatus Krumholzibacteria bacterium]|nr:S41 family peptidase [Candidatus Krumholzibacteria bacterium]